MAELPLAFHATAPREQWLNDPNGLVYADGAYRLFAQHRADPPDFRETGWARFSSPDLLEWTFDGCVIPPQQSTWAYSGCANAAGLGLEAIYTEHKAGLERQVRRVSHDAGLTWGGAEPLPDLGVAARNRRDPFVFRDRQGWILLLAEPCDWSDWEATPASRLRMYRSTDRSSWQETGSIGPWRPPGIMWEVPLLARVGNYSVLFISEVDRREGGATCSVRAWVGEVEQGGFTPTAGAVAEGQLVDHGPDFYALMSSCDDGWPLETPAFVAWLSNWEDARKTVWPGFYGGPISLPRELSIEDSGYGPRLCNRPFPDLIKRFSRPVAGVPVSGLGRATSKCQTLRIDIEGSSERVGAVVDWSRGTFYLERSGPVYWQNEARFPVCHRGSNEVLLFVDGAVLELFMIDEGMSASIALAPTDTFRISAQADDHPTQFDWFELDGSGICGS